MFLVFSYSITDAVGCSLFYVQIDPGEWCIHFQYDEQEKNKGSEIDRRLGLVSSPQDDRNVIGIHFNWVSILLKSIIRNYVFQNVHADFPHCYKIYFYSGAKFLNCA